MTARESAPETRIDLLEAIASAWCIPPNENKQMDADLANAIADQVIGLRWLRSESATSQRDTVLEEAIVKLLAHAEFVGMSAQQRTILHAVEMLRALKNAAPQEFQPDHAGSDSVGVVPAAAALPSKPIAEDVELEKTHCCVECGTTWNAPVYQCPKCGLWESEFDRLKAQKEKILTGRTGGITQLVEEVEQYIADGMLERIKAVYPSAASMILTLLKALKYASRLSALSKPQVRVSEIEGALRVMGAYREALDATGQWTASITVGEAMHRVRKWALEDKELRLSEELK